MNQKSIFTRKKYMIGDQNGSESSLGMLTRFDEIRVDWYGYDATGCVCSFLNNVFSVF